MGPWLKWTAIFYLLVSLYGVGQPLLDRSYKLCLQTCRRNVECAARCEAAAGVVRE